MPAKRTKATPKKKVNRGRPGPNWREVFLATLAETMNVTESCRVALVNKVTAYEHRKNDPAFAAAWDEAIETAADSAEGELYRRAVKGVDRPVYQGGEKVGVIRDYSDTCLIFLLKGRRRAIYAEKAAGENDARAAESEKAITDAVRNPDAT